MKVFCIFEWKREYPIDSEMYYRCELVGIFKTKESAIEAIGGHARDKRNGCSMKTEHEMRMIAVCRELRKLHLQEIENARIKKDFLWFFILNDSKRNLPRVMGLIPDPVIVPGVTPEETEKIKNSDSIGSLIRRLFSPEAGAGFEPATS